MSTDLQQAISKGDIKVVKSLLESGSEITYETLQIAVSAETASEAKKREPICKLLFDAGADPNMARPEGHAHLLDIAAGSASTKIVETTLQAGADIEEGWPLHSAIEEDRLANLQVLVEAGANPSKGLSSDYPEELDEMLGMTALQYAKHIGSKKCLKYLQTIVKE